MVRTSLEVISGCSSLPGKTGHNVYLVLYPNTQTLLNFKTLSKLVLSLSIPYKMTKIARYLSAT
ncbi:hypothetical protein SFRURICE_015313 [Spodoptera frugiperda]|nr:hypothetical protein SFRURICE_015313 [Spodoptera frugiperda]